MRVATRVRTARTRHRPGIPTGAPTAILCCVRPFRFPRTCASLDCCLVPSATMPLTVDARDAAPRAAHTPDLEEAAVAVVVGTKRDE